MGFQTTADDANNPLTADKLTRRSVGLRERVDRTWKGPVRGGGRRRCLLHSRASSAAAAGAPTMISRLLAMFVVQTAARCCCCCGSWWDAPANVAVGRWVISATTGAHPRHDRNTWGQRELDVKGSCSSTAAATTTIEVQQQRQQQRKQQRGQRT